MSTAPRKTATARRRAATAAPKTQDEKPANSAEARRAEAVDGFVDIEQNGVALSIPFGDSVPLEVIEVLVNQAATEPQSGAEEIVNEAAVTKALVGPEQWAAFMATRPTLRDYRELSEKIRGLSGN